MKTFRNHHDKLQALRWGRLVIKKVGLNSSSSLIPPGWPRESYVILWASFGPLKYKVGNSNNFVDCHGDSRKFSTWCAKKNTPTKCQYCHWSLASVVLAEKGPTQVVNTANRNCSWNIKCISIKSSLLKRANDTHMWTGCWAGALEAEV